MAVNITCDCGFVISASSRHGGLKARCARCGAAVAVPFDRDRPAKNEAEASGEVAAEPAASICAACGDSAEETVCCIHCRALYHISCWHEKGGCVAPSCEAGPQSRKRVIHAQTEAPTMVACPACGEMIPHKALRCRFCGAHLKDRKLARRLRAETPAKTSYAAGSSIILGVLTIFLIPICGNTPLLKLLVFMPLTGITVGIWALWDINRAAGEKSGGWMAGFGIALCAIDLLAWLMRVAF